MWSTIQSSQAWNGILKNLRKDGRFYWVDTEILPIFNSGKKITGYISVQRSASKKDIADTEDTYRKMVENETN